MDYLPVPGYEGLYGVSKMGDVISFARKVLGRDGALYPFKERVLKAHPHKDTQYLQVSLWKDNVGEHHYVHRLVAEVFIPNPVKLKEVNHLNGNRQCNHVDNLEWVCRQGNAQHAIATGLKVYYNRLTYSEFLDCLIDVINGQSYSELSARVPYKVPYLSTKLRQIAKEMGMEHELDESLSLQRINRARINGAKNHN